MDLSKIKSKLDSMSDNGSKGSGQKIDYEKIFWRPSEGASQIRIVPSFYSPEYPFTELFFHYNIGKYPMMALSNYGEQDPVVDFINELRKTSDRDNWSLSGKLKPRMRVFAPVIVRGEEDKGVRLWGFGKKVYETLLQLAADEDVGDFTDVVNGFDLVVEQMAGNPYPTTNVRIKPKITPLSDDNTFVEKALKEQPKALDSFRKYDFQFIKTQLENWLTSSDHPATQNAAPAPVAQPAPVAAPAPNYSLQSQTVAKPSVTENFDKLFGDDDLPF